MSGTSGLELVVGHDLTTMIHREGGLWLLYAWCCLQPPAETTSGAASCPKTDSYTSMVLKYRYLQMRCEEAKSATCQLILLVRHAQREHVLLETITRWNMEECTKPGVWQSRCCPIPTSCNVLTSRSGPRPGRRSLGILIPDMRGAFFRRVCTERQQQSPTMADITNLPPRSILMITEQLDVVKTLVRRP